MHRATAKQAQRECEWKRGKGVSSWIVGALVITLTLTREAFSWKPFESDWIGSLTTHPLNERGHLKAPTHAALSDLGDEAHISRPLSEATLSKSSSQIGWV